MSATAAQTAARPVPKVLRIGVVQGGKIVQERLIRMGETVTVGESPKNTFVITGTKLGQRHEIFIARGENYTLSVPDWMEGKISWKDGIRDLEELRARGDATKKGDIYQVVLNENVRGKVSIGESTILFQFVPAPPEPVRQVSPSDFRPRLIDEDDPLFMGLLSVFTLIAGSFMIWVQVTPVPEQLDLELLDEVIDLVVEEEIKQVVIEEKPAEDKGPEEKKPEEKKPEPKPDSQPDEAPQPTRRSVEQRSLLLQQIGTAGSTGSGVVDDILGDDAASMAGLNDALANVNGVETANAQNLALKQGSKNGRTDATVGVDGATTGTSTTGTGVVTKVKKPRVEMGSADDVDVSEGDPSGIASVVRKSNARIQTCVEQSLKVNPNLDGRVTVGWTISAGRVTEAHMVKNSSGDDAVGKCIVNAVRGFRFDGGLSAEVAEFSWVVGGQ